MRVIRNVCVDGWRRASTGLWLSFGCLGLVGSLVGRPIEFSEPTDPSIASSLGRASVKTGEPKDLDDLVFKPHLNGLFDGITGTYRPQFFQPAIISVQPRHSRGSFDFENGWKKQGADNAASDPWQSRLLEQVEVQSENLGDGWPVALAHSKTAPGDATKKRSASEPSDITGVEGDTEIVPDIWDAGKPIEPVRSRSVVGEEMSKTDLGMPRYSSPSAVPNWTLGGSAYSMELMLQARQAEQLDAFKHLLNLPNQVPNPSQPLTLRPTDAGNAFTTPVQTSAQSLGGTAGQPVLIPSTPVAPAMPQLPGQSSLAAPTYSPPQLKPVTVTSPRRVF